jgi:hypothetical protein
MVFTQTHGGPAFDLEDDVQMLLTHEGMIESLKAGMDEMDPETLSDFAGTFYNAYAGVSVLPVTCEFVYEITSGPDPIDIEALEERMAPLAAKGRLKTDAEMAAPQKKGMMAFS